jgi:hypothetical protein
MAIFGNPQDRCLPEASGNKIDTIMLSTTRNY